MHFVSTLAFCLLVAACGGGGETGAPSTDASADDVDAGPHDANADASDVDDTASDASLDAQPDGGPEGLCSRCSEDGDCGGADDRCVALLDSEQRCARACDLAADAPCPDGYQCRELDEETETGQCIPEDLTCRDRCSDVDCTGDGICDPITGECRERLELCDRNCTVDRVCGEGPDDRCLTLNSQERICATGCNPDDDDIECPLNHFCAPLSEDDPTAGGCVPVERTCADRCSGVDCPDGQRCDSQTGQCVDSTYGACQKGCSSNAECAGDGSWCLDLGLQPGRHCWTGCGSGSGQCPDGYDCTQLRNTTIDICIPQNESCQQCRSAACFPEGVCDPTSGECLERARDCRQTGCASGEVCNPRSTNCVEVGRRCRGKSWANDCDGIVTGCTTHTSGTRGVCARICSSDAECSGGRTCRDTNFKSFCLGREDLGPDACGTLDLTATDGGAPCSDDGDCSGGAPECVDGANVRGFCSTRCSSDADCGPLQRCAAGPGGRDVCLPAQCECAAHVGWASEPTGALDSVLSDLGVGQCELVIRREKTENLSELNSLPVTDESLASSLRTPLGSAGSLESRGRAPTASAAGPGEAVERIAAVGGGSVNASGKDYSFGGASSPLAAAAADFIRAAGGTPQQSKLRSTFGGLSSNLQAVAADVVAAAAETLNARDSALSSAGWDASRRQSAFSGAPYLFLPGTSSQEMGAPDLSDSAVRKAYRDFPAQKLASAAADLAASVEMARSPVGSVGDVSASVDTPAGKIVVGGTGDDTYDPSMSAYSGEIAVLVDAGGDDTYRVPAGANQSAANGVSLLVDLGGSDTYTYEEVADPNDGPALLPSDSDGRIKPSAPIGQGDGPVSLSTVPRQGAGRVGIGMLVDYGGADDSYRSLRISQGASVFGVGLLYDDGGADTYRAEALAQGASIGGRAGLWDADGGDRYETWHASQGFATAAGAGLLADRTGDDTYRARPGQSDGTGVLYFSPADRGDSNRNLAQGAGAGLDGASGPGLAGGIGVLSDRSGEDTYRAGTYAQGFGSFEGAGILADTSGGDDYRARALVQGAGRFFGAGILAEGGGDDVYNRPPSMGGSGGPLRSSGQGYGEAFGWGVFHESAGADEIHYANPGGGVGLRAGYGFAVDARGADDHRLGSAGNSRRGPGYALDARRAGSSFEDERTVGIFLDTGGGSDTYSRNSVGNTPIGNGTTWLQPDPPTDARKGAGLDR